jgi:hypothetical protein
LVFTHRAGLLVHSMASNNNSKNFLGPALYTSFML